METIEFCTGTVKYHRIPAGMGIRIGLITAVTVGMLHALIPWEWESMIRKRILTPITNCLAKVQRQLLID